MLFRLLLYLLKVQNFAISLSTTLPVTSDLPQSTKCFSCLTMRNTVEITRRLEPLGGHVRKWHTTWSEQ